MTIEEIRKLQAQHQALAQEMAQEREFKTALMAELTEQREEYLLLAQGGHLGLAGWCLARANKLGAQIDKLFAPPKPQGAELRQEQPQGPGQAGAGPQEVKL